jgi:hypothetical protein
VTAVLSTVKSYF